MLFSCRKSAIAQLGARKLANQNILLYVLYVVEVEGVVQYILEFGFTYFTVRYSFLFMFLSMSCIFVIFYSL